MTVDSLALRKRSQESGFTIAEVLIAITVLGILFSGMLLAYTQAARRAQWSGFSLAAQALAIQQIEQARSAPWDSVTTNAITNLILKGTSFTGSANSYVLKGYTLGNLDLPISGSNILMCTNFVTISYMSLVSTQSPAQLIQIDTVWPFVWRGKRKLFTNSVATLLAPDNCDRLILGQSIP